MFDLELQLKNEQPKNKAQEPGRAGQVMEELIGTKDLSPESLETERNRMLAAMRAHMATDESEDRSAIVDGFLGVPDPEINADARRYAESRQRLFELLQHTEAEIAQAQQLDGQNYNHGWLFEELVEMACDEKLEAGRVNQLLNRVNALRDVQLGEELGPPAAFDAAVRVFLGRARADEDMEEQGYKEYRQWKAKQPIEQSSTEVVQPVENTDQESQPKGSTPWGVVTEYQPKTKRNVSVLAEQTLRSSAVELNTMEVPVIAQETQQSIRQAETRMHQLTEAFVNLGITADRQTEETSDMLDAPIFAEDTAIDLTEQAQMLSLGVTNTLEESSELVQELAQVDFHDMDDRLSAQIAVFQEALRNAQNRARIQLDYHDWTNLQTTLQEIEQARATLEQVTQEVRDELTDPLENLDRLSSVVDLAQDTLNESGENSDKAIAVENQPAGERIRQVLDQGLQVEFERRLQARQVAYDREVAMRDQITHEIAEELEAIQTVEIDLDECLGFGIDTQQRRILEEQKNQVIPILRQNLMQMQADLSSSEVLQIMAEVSGGFQGYQEYLRKLSEAESSLGVMMSDDRLISEEFLSNTVDGIDDVRSDLDQMNDALEQQIGDIRQRQIGLGNTYEDIKRSRVEINEMIVAIMTRFEGATQGLSEQETYEHARSLMDQIEKSRRALEDPRNVVLMERLNQLEESPLMSESLKTERKIRMKMYTTELLVNFLDGNPDRLGEGMDRAVTQLENARLLMTGQDFSYFFNEGFEDMAVYDAFMLIQQASRKDGLSVSGQMIRRGAEKITPTQSDAVDSEIKRLLQERHTELTDANALKSIELADRMATISFEKAVWDREAATFFGKLVHTKAARVRSQPPNVCLGPDVTLDLFPNIAGGFLHQAFVERNVNGRTVKRTILEEADMRDPYDSEAQKRTDVTSRNRAGTIDPRKFNFGELSESTYADYFTYIQRCANLWAFILKDDWSMKDINNTTLDRINTLIRGAADRSPNQERFFGFKLTAGIIDSITRNLTKGSDRSSHMTSINSMISSLIEPSVGLIPDYPQYGKTAADLMDRIIATMGTRHVVYKNIFISALSGRRVDATLGTLFDDHQG